MASARAVPKPSDYYILFVTDERFRIQPCDSNGTPTKQVCLTIDRITEEMTLQEFKLERSFVQVKMIIRGLFGIIKLLAGPYLIVIKESVCVGLMNQQKVYRITKTDLIPYSKSTAHLSEIQLQDNLLYNEMVHTVLSMGSFYYSPTFDITHTVQRLNNTSPEFLLMPLRERADHRFVWNAHLLNDLFQAAELRGEKEKPDLSFYEFAIPIMLGFMEVRELMFAGRPLKLTLISRRSSQRAGVRFQTRGIDDEGNAANYVETEQIVEIDQYLCSFVQTRGSVPVYWSQKPNLRWQPWPKVHPVDHKQGYRYHVYSQSYTYGHQVMISLLNQSGREKEVGDAFDKVVKDCGLVDVRLVAIDFHKECGNMNWDKIGKITDDLMSDLRRFGYFAIKQGENVEVRTQTGVFRTNCMDCLDRTNVVQSLIGLRALEVQMQGFGVLRPGDRLKNYPEFVRIYKNLWADNGDACSIQYAGTAALKSDFTRTGKRTVVGCLRDGYNALMRWYINNFTDGFRQDAIDFFLGGYSVGDLRSIMYAQSRRSLASMLVPACLVFANCMLLLTMFVESEGSMFQMFLWLAVVGGLLVYVYFHGERIADSPKLKIELSK